MSHRSFLCAVLISKFNTLPSECLRSFCYNNLILYWCLIYVDAMSGFKRAFLFFNCQELQTAISCLAGFVHFYQQGFSEARDLFMWEQNPLHDTTLHKSQQLKSNMWIFWQQTFLPNATLRSNTNQYTSPTWAVRASWTPEKSSVSTLTCSRVSARTLNLSLIKWTRARVFRFSGRKTEAHFIITCASWEIFSEQSGILSKALTAIKRWTAPSWGCMQNWETLKICSSLWHCPMSVS